jgi:hypothetical protein
LIVKLGLTVAIKAEEGLMTHFNGLEIVQDRDYIHIHVAPYLDKILANHGWSEEGKQETRLVEPIHPSSIKELETSEGPEDPAAAKAIEAAAGFAYRTDIGEIIFAYVTCRLDISYAVTELSKFSTRPTTSHYVALKHAPMAWFIGDGPRGSPYPMSPLHFSVPWNPRNRALPQPPTPPPPGPKKTPGPPTTLCAYVDAVHANFLRTRRSVGAFVFCLAGTAIAYRAK